MNAFARGATSAATGTGRRDRQRRMPVALLGQSLAWLLFASLATSLFVLVSVYGNGLRDTRFLDGWVLAGGVGLQVCFHVAVAAGLLSPKSASRWRAIHIFTGYLLVAAFVSHTNLPLPDTILEWALWTSFVLVTSSGVFGTYLSWTMKTKRGLDTRIAPERIATRRNELARDIHAIVVATDPMAAAISLPSPPHDAWIADLYEDHLRDFFEGPRNFPAHAIGSGRPLAQLMNEIDALSGFVDRQRLEKLAAIRAMVVEKDRLDLAHAANALTRASQLVHVALTYALVVLMVLHVLAAYAFSSGAW